MCVCMCVRACVRVCLGDSVGWQLVLLVAGQLAVRDPLLSRGIRTSPTFDLSILVWQWLHLMAMLSAYHSVSFYCLHVGFLSPAAPPFKQPSPEDSTPEAHLIIDCDDWRALERYFQVNNLWHSYKLRP